MPTTAAIAKVATGTAIKTMLQIQAPAAKGIYIEGWGYSVDAASSAVWVAELIQTDVAATVTAHTLTGIYGYNLAGTASTVQLGTAATGYTASAEGSITVTKVFDATQQPIAMNLTPYIKKFDPAYRPYIPANGIIRIRTTTTATTNMSCWIKWHE